MEQADHVVEGILRCVAAGCLAEYPIIDGVPIIVPRVREYIAREVGQVLARSDLTEPLESLIGDCTGPGSAFDNTRQQLSSYAWDHWADLDPAEPTAKSDRRPGSVLELARAALEGMGDRCDGPVLDAGCSVGRASFAAADHAEGLVLGVDLNFAMLQLASRALRRGRIRYPRRRVGMAYDRREFTVSLPAATRVDFWACDASALPFRADTFGTALGLNLLDSAASPTDVLRSLSRCLVVGGRAALACPYDWSPGATPVEAWIGGHSQRAEHRGSADVVLRALLTAGAHPASIEGLRLVAEEPNLPWRVRLHDRGAVDYRCHLVVVEKTNGNP